MHHVTMTRPAGTERAPSPYVCPEYGAYSPDGLRSIYLPDRLYKLWVVLTDRPGVVLGYLALTRAFWPGVDIADPDTVRLYVLLLGKKLRAIGWPPECLEVVRGRGVVFHPDRATRT